MATRTPVKPTREAPNGRGKPDEVSADPDTSDDGHLHRSDSSGADLQKSGADRIFDVR